MRRRKILKSLPVITIPTVSGCSQNWMPDYPERVISLTPVRSPKMTDVITEKKEDFIPSPLILDLISTLLSGNEVTIEAKGIELFTDASHADFTPYREFFHYLDGESYYRIDKPTRKTGTVTGLEYKVSRSGVETKTSKENTLPISDLPSHDQWLLHSTLSLRSETGGVIPFSDTFVAGYLDADYQAASLLAGGIDEDFVTFNDRYIKLEENGESSASRERVQYSAELVAEGSTSFSEYIAERYGIKVTGLSSEVQKLVERVRKNGGSLELHEDDENYESVEQAVLQLRSKVEDDDTMADLNISKDHGGVCLNINAEGYVLSW